MPGSNVTPSSTKCNFPLLRDCVSKGWGLLQTGILDLIFMEGNFAPEEDIWNMLRELKMLRGSISLLKGPESFSLKMFCSNNI